MRAIYQYFLLFLKYIVPIIFIFVFMVDWIGFWNITNNSFLNFVIGIVSGSVISFLYYNFIFSEFFKILERDLKKKLNIR